MARDRTGDLVNSGEFTPGEQLVEYAAPIIDSFPVAPYSQEQILELHRQRNALGVPPPPRAGSFRSHSLRRI